MYNVCIHVYEYTSIEVTISLGVHEYMSTTTVKWQDRTWPSYLGSCINTDRTGWIRTVSFY